MIPKKLALLLLLFFVTGCGGFTGGNGGTITVFDPYHGSNGLVITFLENSPPDHIYSGRNFRVGVVVKNDGAFDVDDAVLTLHRTLEDIPEVGDKTKSIQLYGKSTTMRYGAQELVFWDAKTAEVATIEEERTTYIWVIADYKYQTNLFEDICIDPDKYGEKVGDKTCITRDSISFKNQGAPVAVISVEPEIIPIDRTSGDIEFTITVQNIGAGSVTSQGGELNILNIEATLSDDRIECDDSSITLDQGIGKMKCTASYGSKTEYKTPLHIKLDYVYSETTPRQAITLKKL